MNIKIEKVSVINEEAIKFIALEYLNMYVELNPHMKEFYSGGTNNKSVLDFIEDYEERFIKNDSVIYVAYLNDDIVGALQFDDNEHLSCLFVKEEYRNRLIGSRLLERLICECNNNKVITVDARVDSISLYERFSFKKVEDIGNRTFIPMELEMKKSGR